jgi:phosphonate C-P lyase system protein PhnH
LTHAERARLSNRESQSVFGALLDSLARPGRATSMSRALVDRVPPAVAAMLILADVDVAVAVVTDGTPELEPWRDVVTGVSGATPAAIGNAEVVVVLGALSPDLLHALRRGSREHPELGARLIVSCRIITECRDAGAHYAAELDGAVRLMWNRPGCTASSMLLVTGPSLEALEALAHVNDQSPTGIDTWLVDDDGIVVAIPRGSKLHVQPSVEPARL